MEYSPVRCPKSKVPSKVTVDPFPPVSWVDLPRNLALPDLASSSPDFATRSRSLPVAARAAATPPNTVVSKAVTTSVARTKAERRVDVIGRLEPYCSGGGVVASPSPGADTLDQRIGGDERDREPAEHVDPIEERGPLGDRWVR
jgi:hypothetical protein